MRLFYCKLSLVLLFCISSVNALGSGEFEDSNHQLNSRQDYYSKNFSEIDEWTAELFQEYRDSVVKARFPLPNIIKNNEDSIMSSIGRRPFSAPVITEKDYTYIP